MGGVAYSGLENIRTIKASGLESNFFGRWAGHLAQLANTEQRLGLWNQFLGAMPPFLMGLMTALILGIGALRVMNGALSVGQLIAFQSMMMSFMLPVNSLVNLSSVIRSLEAGLDRIDDMLNNQFDPETARTAINIGTETAARTHVSAARWSFATCLSDMIRWLPPRLQIFPLHSRPAVVWRWSEAAARESARSPGSPLVCTLPCRAKFASTIARVPTSTGRSWQTPWRWWNRRSSRSKAA